MIHITQPSLGLVRSKLEAAAMTEIEEKTERLTRMLAAQNLGGVILSAQHNFSWLTGGGSNGIDQSRDAGAGSLLVRRDGKRFVLANRIEMPRLLEEQLAPHDFEPIDFAWEDEKSGPSFLPMRAQALLEPGTSLGSDLPLDASTRTLESSIASCRYQLTESEIERYRSLGQDAGEVVGNLMKTLQPGETEREVARRATDSLAARGMHSVVMLVAGDERVEKFRHPAPTARAWQKILMVVVCARRHGLIASLTRIICAGSIPEELTRRTLGVARVNAGLFAATCVGATGAELYGVAARAYAAAGFPGEQHLHHQGGACGYRTRDWVAHPLSADRAQVNQAFAWNPSITGTKVEETCIAFPAGVETITTSPHWPSMGIDIEGHHYDFSDVLSL
jgi:Xaa-Pro aminopeptidase